MNRRIIRAAAVCGCLVATASLAPAARAGNVAWGISVAGPGFGVAAGQPGFVGAPFFPYARPWFRSGFRTVVAPSLAFVAVPVPFAFAAPAPVVFAPRPVLVRRPVVFVRRPVVVRSWRY